MKTLASQFVFLLLFSHATLLCGQEPQPLMNAQIAADDLRKLLIESHYVNANELDALQNEMSERMAPIHSRNAMENQFRNKLKNADEESLEKVQVEIQNLSDRLLMLERVAEVLSDMNPGAIEEAIEESKEASEEIQREILEIAKPLNADLSELFLSYRNKNEELKEAASILCRNAGDKQFEGFEKVHDACDFVHGTYLSRFQDRATKSSVDIKINFHWKDGHKRGDLLKLNDKYPIYQHRANLMEVIANGTQVRVSQIKNGDKELIKSALLNFVDLDAIAELNTTELKKQFKGRKSR